MEVQPSAAKAIELNVINKNSSDMKKKIYDIVFKAQYKELSTKEATDQLLVLFGVVFSDQQERSRFQKDIDDCYTQEDEGENEAEVCRHCGSKDIIDFGTAKKCSDCRKMI